MLHFNLFILCPREGTSTVAHIWMSEDNPNEWVLYFPCCEVPRAGTRVKSKSDFKCSSRRFYPLSRLSCPYKHIFVCAGSKEIILKNSVRAPLYPHIFHSLTYISLVVQLWIFGDLERLQQTHG